MRVGRFWIYAFSLFLVSCATTSRGPDGAAAPAPIVFMTDFSLADDAVAMCKGVMLSFEPESRIVDLTHQVKAFSIRDASRYLFNVTQFFPKGAVFLVVVDPGVGSQRKAVVVKTLRGQYFVLPDNGIITAVAARDGVEGIREIKNPLWVARGAQSSTFHGRDIFAPVAARIASGSHWIDVGPALAEPVRLVAAVASLTGDGIEGEGVALDGEYGNLITNIEFSLFEKLHFVLGEQVGVRLGKRKLDVTYAKTFSDVPVGAPLLYRDSMGQVAFAVNQGNFASVYQVTPPTSLSLARRGAALTRRR